MIQWGIPTKLFYNVSTELLLLASAMTERSLLHRLVDWGKKQFVDLYMNLLTTFHKYMYWLPVEPTFTLKLRYSNETRTFDHFSTSTF